MKHIFRYLVGTKDLCIHFGTNNSTSRQANLDSYINSNYTSCFNIQKSMFKYFFRFAHGATSWRSKLQECTTTSTTEVEYIKEAFWLGRLACTIQQIDSRWPLDVLSNSQGVVAFVKNLVHHNSSKHIKVLYQFVWDRMTTRKLSLENVSCDFSEESSSPQCFKA